MLSIRIKSVGGMNANTPLVIYYLLLSAVPVSVLSFSYTDVKSEKPSSRIASKMSAYKKG